MSKKTVRNEEELGKAIKDNTIEIEIESDELGKKVLRIKATGAVAWGACIVALGVAVAAVIGTIATGGTAAPVTIPASLAFAAPAVATLGVPVATTAIGIAVAGGGVGILNQLREYDLEQKDGKVILKKK